MLVHLSDSTPFMEDTLCCKKTKDWHAELRALVKESRSPIVVDVSIPLMKFGLELENVTIELIAAYCTSASVTKTYRFTYYCFGSTDDKSHIFHDIVNSSSDFVEYWFTISDWNVEERFCPTDRTYFSAISVDGEWDWTSVPVTYRSTFVCIGCTDDKTQIFLGDVDTGSHFFECWSRVSDWNGKGACKDWTSLPVNQTYRSTFVCIGRTDDKAPIFLGDVDSSSDIFECWSRVSDWSGEERFCSTVRTNFSAKPVDGEW
ncbi:unnamed protein product [Heligmosomoides polygyrus]|uniref:C-type lectin domain-containing protein n=1 Tax=Heligmosomoides polygyrus TaxID=6339 RepID=A0A3P8D0U5_HELPZ|nr:unnamed protein product [Heligmosomoides polygyrus]